MLFRWDVVAAYGAYIGLRDVDPRSIYYLAQALSYAAIYVAVLVGSGVSLWRLGSTLSNCALRPTVLPVSPFLGVLRYLAYPAGCGLVPCLLLAAVFPHYLAARLAAAVCATIFQLGDCSRTGAHNGYLMIWNVWTFCFLPVPLSLGLAFGAATWFILSSGLSKLWIGGMPWCYPSTMQSILASFVYKTPKAGGPVLNVLCRLAISSRLVCGLFGFGTVFFEVCYVALVALVAPRSWQILTALLMVGLHIGIAVVHSSAIGVFFLPNVASYVVGFYDFAADSGFQAGLATREEDWAPFGGYCWTVGIIFNAVACIYSVITRRLISEDWPLTPMALFPWNGKQWRLLHDAFVEGRTRLVGVPASVMLKVQVAQGSPKDDNMVDLKRLLVGCPVVPIVGAAKLRDDEPSETSGQNTLPESHSSSLFARLRHNIFGTSPFAKDLRSYALGKTAGGLQKPLTDGKASEDSEDADDVIYLYDIWTRVLGPTTFQEEMLTALRAELFLLDEPDVEDDCESETIAKHGLPLFVRVVQTWMITTRRLVEVSSGKPVVDCAFVRVDDDDCVEAVIGWGPQLTKS